MKISAFDIKGHSSIETLHNTLISVLPVVVLFAGLLLFSGPASAALVSTEALVSIEKDQEQNAVQHSKNIENNLVSKENKELDVKYVVRQEAKKGSGALVGWENGGLDGTFIVRHNYKADNGIFSDRPDQLDMRIVELLSSKGIDNIEKYAEWLEANIEYKSDGRDDVWSPPEDTLIRGYGDCEDLAFLNAAVARIFGYRPKVFAMIDGIIVNSHATCIFKREGYYFMFDNTKLRKIPVRSVNDFKEYTYANTTFHSVYEIDLDDIEKGHLLGLHN